MKAELEKIKGEKLKHEREMEVLREEFEKQRVKFEERIQSAVAEKRVVERELEVVRDKNEHLKQLHEQLTATDRKRQLHMVQASMPVRAGTHMTSHILAQKESEQQPSTSLSITASVSEGPATNASSTPQMAPKMKKIQVGIRVRPLTAKGKLLKQDLAVTVEASSIKVSPKHDSMIFGKWCDVKVAYISYF